jgi:hypothetical protein
VAKSLKMKPLASYSTHRKREQVNLLACKPLCRQLNSLQPVQGMCRACYVATGCLFSIPHAPIKHHVMQSYTPCCDSSRMRQQAGTAEQDPQ